MSVFVISQTMVLKNIQLALYTRAKLIYTLPLQSNITYLHFNNTTQASVIVGL